MQSLRRRHPAGQPARGTDRRRWLGGTAGAGVRGWALWAARFVTQSNSLLGLSLADDAQFLGCRFVAGPGEKTTTNKDKAPCCRRRKCCERKSYLREFGIA